MRTVKVVYKHSRKSASFHAASYIKNQEKKYSEASNRS